MLDTQIALGGRDRGKPNLRKRQVDVMEHPIGESADVGRPRMVLLTAAFSWNRGR